MLKSQISALGKLGIIELVNIKTSFKNYNKLREVQVLSKNHTQISDKQECFNHILR